MPPVICPRSAILHSAAASIVAGIFELTVSTAARIATFGRRHAERHREIDRVLADVDLVLERRRDVDGGVGDDEHLVIRRHVHDEDVADAAAGAQPGLLRDDGAEQLVGVQAALHQQLRLAAAHQLHGLRRGRMTVRRVDDADGPEAMSARRRDVADLRRRSDEDRRDEPESRPPPWRRRAPSPRTDARRRLAPAQGCGTARAAASYLPVPVPIARSMRSSFRGHAGRRRRGPRFFEQEREHDRERDAEEERLRTTSDSARGGSSCCRR